MHMQVRAHTHTPFYHDLLPWFDESQGICMLLFHLQVCGASGSPCDAVCGGGGCGRCGGESCDGAVTKAEKALKLAEQAEERLTANEGSASALLLDVSCHVIEEYQHQYCHNDAPAMENCNIVFVMMV